MSGSGGMIYKNQNQLQGLWQAGISYIYNWYNES